MTPTRELARQVADVFSSLSDDMSVACIYGGSPMTPQGTTREYGKWFINRSEASSPIQIFKQNY